jgi:LssY C-terminus
MPEATPSPATLAKRWRIGHSLVAGSVVLVLIYLVVAYLILPRYWIHYAHHHPGFDDLPRITRTGDDIPGDPLNVALAGTEVEVKKIVLAAGWYPADPLTLRSCLEIAEATVLKRPYDEAPVSNLYLFDRKQDLAFERPVGDDPRQRHHVRFWRSDKLYSDNHPIWVGSAVYDRRVGLSEKTGQVTHKTGPDIDAERDKLFADLKQTGDLSEVLFVDDFHKVRKGRNGGGDPWVTDGRLEAGIIDAAKLR